MIARITVLLFVIIFSSPAHANSSFSPAKVQQIVLHDWGAVLVVLEGGINTNESCDNKTLMVLKKSNQHFSEMYASLLAAYHAGTSVRGWVNGCHDRHNAPVLTRLDLMPK